MVNLEGLVKDKGDLLLVEIHHYNLLSHAS